MKSAGSLLHGLVVALVFWSASCGSGAEDPVTSITSGTEEPTVENPQQGAEPPVDGIANGEDGAVWDPATEAQVVVKVVHEGSGRPLAGVPLILYWQIEGEALGRVRAFSQDDGRFAYSVDAPVFITKVDAVSTPATGPAFGSVKKFMQPGESTEVKILVPDAALFSGRVIDDDGTPVVGAKILGFRQDRWEVEGLTEVDPTAVGSSDQDGRFRIGGMAGGRFLMTAEAEGKLAVQRAAGFNEAGKEIKNIEIVLATAHPVYGQVVAPDGSAVANAEVTAGEPKRRISVTETKTTGLVYLPPRQWVVRTDQDGNFTLPKVPDGETWNLAVQHPAFLRHFGKLEADEAVVRVELDPGRHLELHIGDVAGKEISSGRVIYLGRGRHEVRIPQNGQVTMSGLDDDPDGRLYLHSPGYAMQVLWPLPEDQQVLELTMSPAQPILGQVLDATGQSIADTRIRVRGLDLMPKDLAANFPGPPPEQVLQMDEVLSDREGRFQVTGLYSGRFEVVFEAPDGRTLTRTVEAGTRDLGVVFE